MADAFKFIFGALVVLSLLAGGSALMSKWKERSMHGPTPVEPKKQVIELLDAGNVRYTSYLILRDTRNGREYLCVHEYGVCPLGGE